MLTPLFSDKRLAENRLQRIGTLLGLAGLLGWSAALPFTMVQHARFTGISLWVMLGGYLISLAGGLRYSTPGKSYRLVIVVFLAFALFPLMDFWRWENQDEALKLVVLRLAMVMVPFLVSQLQSHWPLKWSKWAIATIIISLLINSFLTLSVGPAFIFNSIRNGISIDQYYYLHRPYYGLYYGAIIVGGITLFYKSPRLVSLLIFMAFSGIAIVFLWILLDKMAILGLIFVMSVWALLRVSSALFPSQKRTVLFGIILMLVGIAYKKSVNSTVYKQLREKGQIDFATVNKNYANSFNMRLVLWQASIRDVVKSGAWFVGYGTANAQRHTNEAVCKVDEALCRLKLDPHNVWLAEWFQHGLPGVVLVSLLFLIPAWHFEENHFQPYMWIWLFVAFCCISETYINREMGVQTLVWLAVVLPAYVALEKAQILPEQQPSLTSDW